MLYKKAEMFRFYLSFCSISVHMIFAMVLIYA